MINTRAYCKKCNATFGEIFLGALMQEAGAKVYGYCDPKDHEFDQPVWIPRTSTPKVKNNV
jgi:hypothetical protein